MSREAVRRMQSIGQLLLAGILGGLCLGVWETPLSRAAVFGIQRDQWTSALAFAAFIDEEYDSDGGDDIGFGDHTFVASGSASTFTGEVASASANSNASYTLGAQPDELLGFSGGGTAYVSTEPGLGVSGGDGYLGFSFATDDIPTVFDFSINSTLSASGNNSASIEYFLTDDSGIVASYGSNGSSFSEALTPNTIYEFQVSGQASGGSGVTSAGWDFTGEFTTDTQRIVLAFGHDTPEGSASRLIETPFGMDCATTSGTDPAFEPFVEEVPGTFADYQLAVQEYVAQQFEDSGIESIEIVIGEPEPGATNVYFVERICPNLLGSAPVDRFNSNPEDVIVMQIGDEAFDGEVDFDPEILAEGITHEVGHTLGLNHINPPGSLAVMDYDSVAGETELFQNGVFNLEEPPNGSGVIFGVTSNPVYHLRRYVDGVSHDDLVAQGIMPGTWDLPQFTSAELEIQLDFDDPFQNLELAIETADGASPLSVMETTLYDFVLLESDGELEVAHLLAEFDAITLGELANLQFEIGMSSSIKIYAASAPGGELDVTMSLGDPFDASQRFIYAGGGQTTALLQMSDGSQDGYATIAEVSISVSVVPEPSTLLGALIACSVATALRRRVVG